MTPDPESIVAVLPQGDPRAELWTFLFTVPQVPVTKAMPEMTAFPDGSKKLCYFVDFASCDWLKPHMVNRFLERDCNPVLFNMLNEDMYPIVAEEVIIIRGPRSIWPQAG